MQTIAELSDLEPVQRPLFADTVFETLLRKILCLQMQPGTRLSETAVAQAMGVSRQPVRDAFYRLSKLGLLTIRPQRATMVSTIAEEAVMQARFVREAIEQACLRASFDRMTEQDLDDLGAILDQQARVIEPHQAMEFHELDDLFHREICKRSGNEFAWDIIRENKAHIDRVRFLSLSYAGKTALEEHREILQAMRQRDREGAASSLNRHLSRIKIDIHRIRAEHPAYFDGALSEAR